jgi:hypothetical protein
MSTYSSKDVILLLDGYNVLGQSTELNYLAEALTEEETALGDTWESHEYLGIQRTEITQNGFYNDASNSINDALSGESGEDRVLCFGFEGNTSGNKFTGFAGTMQINYERVASLGSLHKVNVRYVGTGQAKDGRILLPLSTITADGDTELSAIDNSASSSGGAYLFLHVTDLTLDGYTDLSVSVTDSTDDITFSTLDTFTAVTSAPAVERRLKTGTINRYLAVDYSFTGAGDDPSATFFVGAVRL